MRSSKTIVEKLDRWLTSPGWAYWAVWYFRPMPLPRPQVQRPEDSGRQLTSRVGR